MAAAVEAAAALSSGGLWYSNGINGGLNGRGFGGAAGLEAELLEELVGRGFSQEGKAWDLSRVLAGVRGRGYIDRGLGAREMEEENWQQQQQLGGWERTRENSLGVEEREGEGESEDMSTGCCSSEGDSLTSLCMSTSSCSLSSDLEGMPQEAAPPAAAAAVAGGCPAAAAAGVCKTDTGAAAAAALASTAASHCSDDGSYAGQTRGKWLLTTALDLANCEFNGAVVYWVGDYQPGSSTFDLSKAEGPFPVDLGNVFYAPTNLYDEEQVSWGGGVNGYGPSANKDAWVT